ncbi:MAG TPA: NAD(P)/FAD-dependent oxidoreductase, partial [Chryseosolibacter sp.]|nr:NAD(P)/FAD-dependent oxidoreductase [Chryseosolibacter sp.]
MDEKKHIGIVGGGLVGCLLSIYLIRRGYRVTVFERRPDVRKKNSDEGRSINLALSTRGIRSLEQVGIFERVRQIAIPMHGRMMHDRNGGLSFLPYGTAGQYINSISRSGLNQILMDHAEQLGVRFRFQHRCVEVDLQNTSATFRIEERESSTQTFDLLIGADGAFSAVRSAMQITDRFNYSQYYLEHGYKELEIPPVNGRTVFEKQALHIWPRESYMMIALPNPDESFTCTLFFPFEGDPSFSSLSDPSQVTAFFKDVFPDALAKMPTLNEDYYRNPTSSLVTIRCFPWTRNKTFLIGDAAHGIVPFYGQGMNAGFEDCRILNELLDQYRDDWPRVLDKFQRVRKEDSDAIAQLAFDNFVEMRDHVADPSFLLRKQIEAKLHTLYPDRWIPLYSMVTFNDNIRYSEAYRLGKKQEQIMNDVMKTPRIDSQWQTLNFKEIVDRLT